MNRRILIALTLLLPLAAPAKNRLKVDGITGASRKTKKRRAKAQNPQSEGAAKDSRPAEDAVSGASRKAPGKAQGKEKAPE